MPAINMNLYDNFRLLQVGGDGAVDLSGVTVKMLIVDDGYTPNQNTHTHRDDLGANEVSGDGYTAGGATLSNPTISMDVSGKVTVDFDDPTPWGQEDGGVEDGDRFVIYVARGGAADEDELISYSDSTSSGLSNKTGELAVTLSADGIVVSSRPA